MPACGLSAVSPSPPHFFFLNSKSLKQHLPSCCFSIRKEWPSREFWQLTGAARAGTLGCKSSRLHWQGVSLPVTQQRSGILQGWWWGGGCAEQHCWPGTRRGFSTHLPLQFLATAGVLGGGDSFISCAYCVSVIYDITTPPCRNAN